MAGLQVSIRKGITFQGRYEEFSNVYYMGNGALGSNDAAVALDVIKELIALERPIFSTDVDFLGGYARELGLTHQPVSGPAIATWEELPGVKGTMGASTTGMYRECAVMVRWLIAGKRHLRSMLHTCHAHGLFTDGVTSATPGGAPLLAYANAMLTPRPSGYRRIAPNGDLPVLVVLPKYLEHRQFHEGRKRATGILG